MKILNVNYKISYLKVADDYMKDNNALGYCDFEKKEIKILKGSDCLLHELLHAYLFEYKRTELAQNEEVIETLESIFKELKKCKKL